MYVKFWGTRGSIPTPLSSQAIKEKIRHALRGAAGLDLTDKVIVERYLAQLPFTAQNTAGGNTTCLEVRSGDQLLIIDAGSGLRCLGLDLMQRGFDQGNRQADMLFTHTHWDHILAWPYFQPAFVPDNRFTLHSPFPDLAERLQDQQNATFFPVPLAYMKATLEFEEIGANQWHRLGKFRVFPVRLSHPGETYGYRIEDDRSSLVLATDSEYKSLKPESTESFVRFFQDADMLIFDAQYSLTEVLDKPDWGHSSAVMGAELAHRADVKRLALFHHDPTSTDEEIWSTVELAEAYLTRRPSRGSDCEVFVAYDGLVLEI
jgi:phosphoribosyl 1,2-cyclic phosphodiesterase